MTLESTTRDALASLIDCAVDRLTELEDRERELQARNNRLFGADHDRWNDPVVASLRDSIWIASKHVDDLMPHTCPDGHEAVELTAITTLRKCGECSYEVETDRDGNSGI